MRVRNPNLAGRSMQMRFSGERVEFDDKGEAEVPDKDGKFLCATNGWSEVGAKAPRPPATPSKPPEPALVPFKPKPPEPPSRDDEPTVQVKTDPPPAEEEDDEEAEEIDVDGLRTHAQLDALAEKYEVDLSDCTTVAEKKAKLNEELFEDSEED